MNLAALFGFNKKEPVITKIDDKVIRLDIECVSCNQVRSVTAKAEDYEKYKKGAYIQDAFRYHSANDRELIQSHMCAACFDGCTKDPEDDLGTAETDETHENDARS